MAMNAGESTDFTPEYIAARRAARTDLDDIRETKQVIVMRKDLNMRKGKMVAQGAHASTAFLTRQLKGGLDVGTFTRPERLWIAGIFTKICVGVNSEEELVKFHEAGMEAGTASIIIKDKGITEFHDVPTLTCCAIGPDYVDIIDAVTGELTLL